jgi:hypothetical protein
VVYKLYKDKDTQVAAWALRAALALSEERLFHLPPAAWTAANPAPYYGAYERVIGTWGDKTAGKP